MGFNFNKISIERFPSNDDNKNLKIDTNINIKSIKELKTDILKSKEIVIGIEFGYQINYEPKIAKLDFVGNIILSVDQKQAKTILREWEDKKIEEDFKFTLFNVILKKANIKAIQLEDELNLPLHLPFPSLQRPKQE